MLGEPSSNGSAVCFADSTSDLTVSFRLGVSAWPASLFFVWGVIELQFVPDRLSDIFRGMELDASDRWAVIFSLPRASLGGKQDFRQIAGDKGAPLY